MEEWTVHYRMHEHSKCEYSCAVKIPVDRMISWEGKKTLLLSLFFCQLVCILFVEIVLDIGKREHSKIWFSVILHTQSEVEASFFFLSSQRFATLFCYVSKSQQRPNPPLSVFRKVRRVFFSSIMGCLCVKSSCGLNLVGFPLLLMSSLFFPSFSLH